MKKRICIIILILIVGCCAACLLVPLPFSKYMEDCTSITVFYISDNIEHTPIVTETFEKDTEPFTELKALLSEFSFHRSLRSFSKDESMSDNHAGYWLHIYIDVGDDRTVLTCGGTGEIIFDHHVYRMGYCGDKVALSFMSQIVGAAFAGSTLTSSVD